MKIGVTGSKGFVGSRLVERGYTPIDVDVTNADQVRQEVHGEKFDAIIHTAAITDVEYCQRNRKEASKVNVKGAINLADWFDGTLIYISSDHIFDGKKFFGGGYSEKHKPSPVNIYGVTKLAGETMTQFGKNSTKIIRTSKLFDRNRITPVMSRLRQGEEITVSNVLKRSFLHVDHFVEGLEWVVTNLDKTPPILNISGTDIFTIYNFYCVAARKFGLDEALLIPNNKLLKIATPRPIRAGLNVSKAKRLGVPLYSGHDGIALL